MRQSSSKCPLRYMQIVLLLLTMSIAFLIFHDVQSLTSSFHRVDIVFDQYLEQSLKEDTRKAHCSRFFFTGNTKLPNKIAEDFLMKSADKDGSNKFLAKKFHHFYRGD